VEMEYYMQHVEHYTRVLNLAETQDAARNQDRHARHQSRQMEEGQEDESMQEAGAEFSQAMSSEEGEPHAFQERGEHQKPRHRQRRHRRDYQERNASEENTAEPVSDVSASESFSPEQEQKKPMRRRQPRQTAAKDTQQQNLLPEDNSGASLRDVLPAPRL
jgi:hypothetical protein